MHQSLRLRTCVVLVLALLFVTAAAAPAPTSAQTVDQTTTRPAARVGNVAQMTASGFTLETRAGNVLVTVTDQTWIIVERDGRAVEGTLADLVAGKPAAVAGMLAADGRALAARTLAQGPLARRLADRLAQVQRRPAARAMQHLGGGTITSVEGSKITLKGDRAPSIVVVTLPETIVLRGGFSDLSTLKVGEHLQVMGVPVRPAPGTADGPRTIVAWALRVDSGTTGFFHGRVSRLDGSTLIVNKLRGRDRLTVNIDGSTQFRRISVSNGKPSVATASLTDIQAGAHVAIEGAVAPDGRSIAAKAVLVLGAPIGGIN
jgi:hypothetical protein